MLDGMCLNGVLMFFMIGGNMISEITWVIILFFFQHSLDAWVILEKKNVWKMFQVNKSK